MAVGETTTPPRAPSEAPVDDLRTMIETDRRRGRIGLHMTSDMTRPAYLGASLWLNPDAAERLARELLGAVTSWRDDQAATGLDGPDAGRAGQWVT